MKRWIIVIGLSISSLFASFALAEKATPDFATIQLSFRQWGNSYPGKTPDPWIQRTVRVAVGDTFGSFPDPSWGKGPVFRVSRVESPRRVWIHFSPMVIPDAHRLRTFERESVLVTTVRRGFHTPTYDATLNYHVTVLDSGSAQAKELPVEKIQRVGAGFQDLEGAVWGSDLVALGRVERVGNETNSSLDPVSKSAVMTFVVEEAWKGVATPGDVFAIYAGRMTTDSTVMLPAFSTPILQGDLILAFLNRDEYERLPLGQMRMPLCGLLAQRERLVFEPLHLGKGVSLDSCRARILRAVDELHAPYTGRFSGQLFDGDTSLPIEGATIRDSLTGTTVRSDESGSFEMRFLPIGLRVVEITDPCYPRLRGTAVISDEFANIHQITMGPRKRSSDCP